MKCPGQDSRFWRPGAIFEAKCPQCGHAVEFFKDESSRKCPHCGHKFVNPKMDFGCAAYCKFAEQCLGDLPPELLAQRDSLLKDRVALEMKKYFGRDFKRIAHASKVARYAEQLALEMGADPAVVLSAAYLHDVGLRDASAEDHAEKGVDVARQILTHLGAREELIQEVGAIIQSHHEPPSQASLNFQCVFDADTLVNLEEALGTAEGTSGPLEDEIEHRLLTEAGKALARKVLMDKAR
ncbi:HDIG domain-containing protein [Desulfacinum hydrothermale DSM 13146]|uniref:HDIG domain-containing protein n=1 Tax=Desulfacinum hydrothermale DSM 13146 TaxID=1121390 RepID=A0A1W1XV04_9BACT|nr:HD domain-containing protein [Desulfacinum hydrothermale]SMC27789.1 HDIG domain-containing protein [Desulfacinum hydrothermale DSM 13146]